MTDVVQDKHMPANRYTPRGDQARQQGLKTFGGGGTVLTRWALTIEPISKKIGEGSKLFTQGAVLLSALIENLNCSANEDRHKKGDDQGGDCAAQRWLGQDKPVVCWFRDRLCQSLDRIGLDACLCCTRSRHFQNPLRMLPHIRIQKDEKHHSESS